jgi:hypothetical protein
VLKTVSSFILDDHIIARFDKDKDARRSGSSDNLSPVSYKNIMGRKPFDLNSADEVAGIREEN